MDELIIKDLMEHMNNEKKVFFPRFFKTGKGEYGEGDQFLGIVVPTQRLIAKKYYKDINLDEIKELIKNPYHEVRLTALLILTYKMKKASTQEKKAIFELYINNTKYINNWDLVDLSAPLIVGAYLYDYKLDRSLLYDFAKSNDLWKQRIAILSTHYFIKHNEYEDTLKIAVLLINHKHDLIHKAVGWMLREVGNRDYQSEYHFLIKYYKEMPRTMLRYAIEKFDDGVRLKFLKGVI